MDSINQSTNLDSDSPGTLITQPSLIEKYAVRVINGGKGKGKTTYMLGDVAKNIPGLAQKYLLEYNMKVVFVDTQVVRDEPPDYKSIKLIPWEKVHLLKKGTARVIMTMENKDEAFQHFLNKEIRETLFVIEDSIKIVPQALDKSPYEALFIDSKNKHNSYALMYHMWSHIPPRLLGILDRYVIFKTVADRPRDRGIRHVGVLEAYERVQKHELNWYHEVVNNE